MAVAPIFTPEDAKIIISFLPAGIPQRRLKLLPKILNEWSQTDLRSHLSVVPKETRLELIKRLEKVENCAKTLSLALNDRNNSIENLITIEIARAKKPGRSQIGRLNKWLEEAPDFLNELAIAATVVKGKIKRKRGHPRNEPAGLVLMDIIAIYEWLTNQRATRQVDRDGKGDIGPFWDFAVAIWPLVFRKGKNGLSATLKKWADAVKRKLDGTRSPLIANIAMRYPTWRVFKS